jgi:hypothetical protein
MILFQQFDTKNTLFILRDSRHHHPGCNVHSHELLKQELGSIWKLHLRYLSLVLAALALECVVSQVSDCNDAAQVTDVDAVRVRDLEEALAQELCCAVRDLTI